MPDPDPLHWSVAELIAAYSSGTISPVEVAESALTRIEAVDDSLNAYVRITPELAREQARMAEAAYRRGDTGPLAGIPVSIKDAFHLAGHPTTLGSLAHVDDVAAADSGVVARLRAAGAVFTGKTNVSEFCQSGTTDNLLGPPTANPWDTGRTPAGSSGGAAASVAAGTCPLAVGSDGGGSIRNPAAFTGLVGLKPTTGRCPDERGFRAFSPFVAPGPLAWRVDDARRVLAVLLGDPVKASTPGVVRIGWCARPEQRPVDRHLADVVAHGIATLAALGHDVAPIDPPLADWTDGFGPLLVSEEFERRGTLLDDDVEITDYERRTLEAGRRQTAAAVQSARRAQERHRAAVDALFDTFDAVATPATAVPAFELGARPRRIAGEPVDTLWGAFPFAVPFNVSGHPAIVVPVGLARGLPVAVQLVGAWGGEARLLDLAEQLEAALDLRLWRHDLGVGANR